MHAHGAALRLLRAWRLPALFFFFCFLPTAAVDDIPQTSSATGTRDITFSGGAGRRAVLPPFRILMCRLTDAEDG